MNLHGKVYGNKYWELEMLRQHEWQWFKFCIDLTRKTDHAGFRLEIEVLGYNLMFQIYDCRHWDYENNEYVKMR